jgi:hypothetical protein
VIEWRLVTLLAIFASPRHLPTTTVKFANRTIEQTVAVCDA